MMSNDVTHDGNSQRSLNALYDEPCAECFVCINLNELKVTPRCCYFYNFYLIDKETEPQRD